MKKIIFLFALVILSFDLKAQAKNDSIPEEEIYSFVEEDPAFNGNLFDYVRQNIRYPQGKKVSGKVFVRFVVEKDGSIGPILIERGLADCPECDAEVKRMVQNMPPWRPAKMNGKTVRCWMRLPINFTT